jgi:citrate synthase
MTLAAVLLLISLSELGTLSPIIGLLSVATLPIVAVSVAVAILRYRLYDIDRIISRSISYGLVTALLVTTFLLVNLGLQALLSQMTSGNSLAIAASTLLAAGLFTPIRARVQRIVDRRFDRARYDAEETATAFSVRMRDATDLPTVANDLNVTVRQAIAPSRVGLWLR